MEEMQDKQILQNTENSPAPITPAPSTSANLEANKIERNNPEFETLLNELRQEIIVEGYSAKTLKMYLLYSRDVLYSINKPVAAITKRDVVSYLAKKKEGGCENSTLALIHAAMEYMFKKYLKMNILEEIKIPKKAKTLPKVLTKDEIRLLFQNTRFGRNRLMLQFMYGSGCRVSEVVKLKVEDLNLKERTASIRGGKGNKDRMIILSKEWIHDLKKYLDKKKIKSEFVFSKKNGKNITTDTIQRIVRDSAEKAKINKHVTPHCLRHSYATHLLEAGTNIRYIQSLLGHSNLNTTQIYTSVANDQLKKVVSPLDKL
jgi:site-specific recombinase XerD